MERTQHERTLASTLAREPRTNITPTTSPRSASPSRPYPFSVVETGAHELHRIRIVDRQLTIVLRHGVNGTRVVGGHDDLGYTYTVSELERIAKQTLENCAQPIGKMPTYVEDLIAAHLNGSTF